MSKKNKKKKNQAPEAPEKKGAAGYLVGGLLGLGILGLMVLATRKEPSTEINEYPQLVVMAEFDDLSDDRTRADLARLQRDLIAQAELGVLGPLNFPVLLPERGAVPSAKDIDALSPGELRTAAPLFRTSGWLVPRVYSPDLKSAVIRCYPKGTGRFISGTARKVQELLKSYEGSTLRLTAYSHELQLESEVARKRINVVFGVQSANVAMIAPEGKLKEAATWQELVEQTEAMKDPNLRSIVSIADFARYARAVRRMTPGTPRLLGGDEQWIVPLARRCRLPEALLRKDGKTGVILVSTSAEGPDNRKLAYWVAANVNLTGLRLDPMRIRR